MASTDPEKGRVIEDGTASSESTLHPDHDYVASKQDGAVGEPDVEHEETEKMDRGHELDLERQEV